MRVLAQRFAPDGSGDHRSLRQPYPEEEGINALAMADVEGSNDHQVLPGETVPGELRFDAYVRKGLPSQVIDDVCHCPKKYGWTRDWHAPIDVDRWVCSNCLRPSAATAARLAQ